MKADPILEELWKVKDDLAREAGYDARRFMENLRRWEEEHPHAGPMVRNAAELRQFLAGKERRPAGEAAMALNDKPPEPRQN